MKKLFLTSLFLIGIIGFASANTAIGAGSQTAQSLASLGVVAGGLIGRKAMQNIEATAVKELENYEDNYEDDYDGEGDDFMDFGGNDVSFRNESTKGRTLQVTFTNTMATDQTVILNPSFKDFDASDVPIAAVAKQGTFIGVDGTGVASNGKPTKIEDIRRFGQYNPLRITGFRLSSTGTNSVSAIDDMIVTVTEASIFRNLGDRQIIPAHYKNENTFQNNILTVPEGFDMNDQCRVAFNLRALSSVTFTFIIGGSINSAKALETKAMRAGRSHKR